MHQSINLCWIYTCLMSIGMLLKKLFKKNFKYFIPRGAVIVVIIVDGGYLDLLLFLQFLLSRRANHLLLLGHLILLSRLFQKDFLLLPGWRVVNGLQPRGVVLYQPNYQRKQRVAQTF